MKPRGKSNDENYHDTLDNKMSNVRKYNICWKKTLRWPIINNGMEEKAFNLWKK